MLAASYAGRVADRDREYIDDSHTAQRIAKVARWLTDARMKPMLLLYGGVGNGKTTMARAVARLFEAVRERAAREISSGPWLTISNPDRAVRAEWDSLQRLPAVLMATAQSLADLAKREDARYDALKRTKFLVIDDLGCEPAAVKVYGTEVTPVTDILCYRYDQRLATIVTTNLRTQDIRRVYGDRVADRFSEVFERIGYNCKSYRK